MIPIYIYILFSCEVQPNCLGQQFFIESTTPMQSICIEASTFTSTRFIYLWAPGGVTLIPPFPATALQSVSLPASQPASGVKLAGRLTQQKCDNTTVLLPQLRGSCPPYPQIYKSEKNINQLQQLYRFGLHPKQPKFGRRPNQQHVKLLGALLKFLFGPRNPKPQTCFESLFPPESRTPNPRPQIHFLKGFIVSRQFGGILIAFGPKFHAQIKQSRL